MLLVVLVSLVLPVVLALTASILCCSSAHLTHIVTVPALAMVTSLVRCKAPTLRKPVAPSTQVLWIVTVEDEEMWK